MIDITREVALTVARGLRAQASEERVNVTLAEEQIEIAMKSGRTLGVAGWRIERDNAKKRAEEYQRIANALDKALEATRREGGAQIYGQMAIVVAAMSEWDVAGGHARGFHAAVEQVKSGEIPLADQNAVARAANLSAVGEISA